MMMVSANSENSVQSQVAFEIYMLKYLLGCHPLANPPAKAESNCKVNVASYTPDKSRFGQYNFVYKPFTDLFQPQLPHLGQRLHSFRG